MYTKSDSYLPFETKLKQLTQFNQALIYGFEPESSAQEKLRSERYQDTLFPKVGQFEDMLAGYLFAQNELLPAFKKENLDETAFINSIKQLHSYIGNTILALAGIPWEKSGQFVQMQVLRWRASDDTDSLTNWILSETTHPSLQGYDPTHLLIRLLTTELGLTEAQVHQFVALLQRLKDDPTITPRASQKKFVDTLIEDPQLYKAVITKEKLAVACLGNKLSAEEKELVSKIVTICNDPDDMPKLMDDFAKTTLANWRKCDKNDIKAVSQCLAEMFFQFTDIHPFGNANGRTAVCLLNVFLVSIGLPSILMRNPRERYDSSSSFSQAINAINQTREPLANHIYQKILEAQKHAFSDEKVAEVITVRCRLAHQLKSLQSKHPQIDINDYSTTMYQCAKAAMHKYSTDEDIAICGLNKFLSFLAEEEKRLDQSSSKEMAKVTSSTSTTTSTSTQSVKLKGGFFTSVKTEGNKALDAAKVEKCSDPSLSKGKTTVTGFIGSAMLSDGEIDQLKQDLSSLTNTGGWKINSRNHLDSWMETSNETEAERVFKLLYTAGVGKVIKGKHPKNNQIHVVQCLNTNLNELKNKIKSNNEAEATAPDSEKVNAEVNNASVTQ